MNWQLHNKRQSLTQSLANKPLWADYSTDQKKFTDYMFNVKLKENSYKISFKALLIKIQWSKN